MCAKSDSNTDDTIFNGRGEFQIKDVYVRAEVEVRSGKISEVSFSSPSRDIFNDASEMAKRLKGRRVSEALEENDLETNLTGDRPSMSPSKVALLEAFHRAVEACFDSE